jgi:acyl carrier protein
MALAKRKPDVRDRVYAVIAKSQRIPVERVQEATSLNDVRIDSLDALNVIFSLEEEFKITIKTDINRISSLDDLVNLVERQLAVSKKVGPPK